MADKTSLQLALENVHLALEEVRVMKVGIEAAELRLVAAAENLKTIKQQITDRVISIRRDNG